MHSKWREYRINRAFCLLQAWSRMSSRVGERDMMSAGETRGWRMRRGTVVSCDHCYDTVREKGCSTVKGDKTRGTLQEVHVQVTERLRRVCLSNSGWDADDHESRLPPPRFPNADRAWNRREVLARSRKLKRKRNKYSRCWEAREI